jgi:hypothetical protein
MSASKNIKEICPIREVDKYRIKKTCDQYKEEHAQYKVLLSNWIEECAETSYILKYSEANRCMTNHPPTPLIGICKQFPVFLSNNLMEIQYNPYLDVITETLYQYNTKYKTCLKEIIWSDEVSRFYSLMVLDDILQLSGYYQKCIGQAFGLIGCTEQPGE